MLYFLRSFSALLLLISATYAVFAEPSSSAPATETPSPAKHSRIVEGYGKLPLSFEPNQGQAEPQVRFLSQGDGYRLSLTSSGAVLFLPGKTCTSSSRMRVVDQRLEAPQPCVASQSSSLRMSLLGSNPDTKTVGQDELPGKTNYFVGNEPSGWHTGISNYRKVHYQDVYSGIDLIYYGNERQLEHDFIVKRGADPKLIRLSFTGAHSIDVARDGSLTLRTDRGDVQLSTPVIYQNINGRKISVVGGYVRNKRNEIGFSIRNYDRNQDLIIDPVLVYSTFLQNVTGVAVDHAGNTFLVGTQYYKNSDPNNNPDGDTTSVVVSKLSPDGTVLLYKTVIGPATSGNVAVDDFGNAYITGAISLNTFPAKALYPVVNAFQAKPNGPYNPVITKLDPTGSKLIFSTFFGGDSGLLALDASGSVYLTGTFIGDKEVPFVNPLVHADQGVYVAKFAPSGRSLEYSTPIGNGLNSSIAVDPSGEAIVTGVTLDPKFPVVNALFPKYNTTTDSRGNGANVFVTKINASGTGILYSTFFAAGNSSHVATNANGEAFIAGNAYAGGLPTSPHALYPSNVRGGAFVSRINSTGSALIYSTYLGSYTGTVGYSSTGDSIAVDKNSNAYVVGTTPIGFPLVNPIQSQIGGTFDVFVAKLNDTGAKLLYSTYFGGTNLEDNPAIAVSEDGDASVIGRTFSTDFPLKNPLVNYQAGAGFVAKIAEPTGRFSITNVVDHATVSPGGDLHYTITVKNQGTDSASGSLQVTSLRDRFRTCTVSNGDRCKFAVLGGQASVDISSLSGGSSRTVSIYATAAKTAGDYNLIRNTATVTGISQGSTDSDSATTTVREVADISLASSLVDNTNGLLHVTHTIANTGPDNAHAVLFLSPLPIYTAFVSASTTAGQCSFKPTLGPYGSVRCPLGNPNVGGFVQVDIVLKASRDACQFVNADPASVTSQSIDGNNGNDSTAVAFQLPVSFCAN